MCVIIDKPAGVEIPVDMLQNGMDANPDGWGVMWTEDGKIEAYVGMKEENFWHFFELAMAEDRHVTVHFRWATHGSRNTDNCHPFLFGAGGRSYAVMHNGILNVTIRERKRSDTWHYCADVLQPLLDKFPDAFEDPKFKEYIERHVGHNKLIIMRDDGKRLFINPDLGLEHEGLWMSNNSPLTRPKFSWGALKWKDERDDWELAWPKVSSAADDIEDALKDDLDEDERLELEEDEWTEDDWAWEEEDEAMVWGKPPRRHLLPAEPTVRSKCSNKILR